VEVTELPAGGFAGVLARAGTGDQEALRALFRAYQPRLLRFLRGLEPAAADDLAAEVWLGVARRLPEFRGEEDDFRAWLFAIARKRVADHRRRGARRPRTVPLRSDAAERPGPTDPAAVVVDEAEAQAIVDHIVAALPSAQAEVVLLRVLGGLSAEQVAVLTGRSAGAVRVLQHRALRRLARLLSTKVVTP
jgi:RNA polymerase sigma-70 factor (ECF subfamily)